MRRSSFRFLFRAAVTAAALFIVSALTLVGPLNYSFSASAVKAKQEAGVPVDKLISQAQELTLEKKRRAATSLLVEALNSGAYKEYEQQKLKNSLNQLSTMFYTDEAQRLYALGESLLYSDESSAKSRYKEALALEEGHLTILLSLAHHSLTQRECDEALNWIKQAQQSNPFYPDLKLAQLQAFQCGNQWGKVKSLVALQKGSNEAVNFYYEILRAALMIHEGQMEEATKHLSALERQNSEFPELYYWKWKAGQAKTRSWIFDGQKYIFQCKNISNDLRRRFHKEPFLCSRVEEVTKSLEGIGELPEESL